MESLLAEIQLLCFKGACKKFLIEDMNVPTFQIFKQFNGKKFEVNILHKGEYIRKKSRAFKTYDDAWNYCWYQQDYDVWAIYDGYKISFGGEILLNKQSVSKADLRRLMSPAGRSAERQMRRLDKKKYMVKFIGHVLKQEPQWTKKTNK